MLYFIAGLTYQTSALFAVMPLAAVLLVRGVTRGLRDTKWIVAHLGALFGSLFAGFLLMNVAFTEGVVAEAARMQFEPHPFIKLLWFARNPLPNSIALFALRDSSATPAWFWLVARGRDRCGAARLRLRHGGRAATVALAVCGVVAAVRRA